MLFLKRPSDGKLASLQQYGTPFVVLTSNTKGAPSHVTVDYELLIGQCVEALASQGCRSLGLFGILCEHLPIFLESARKHGLAVEDRWIDCPDCSFYPAADSHEFMGRENAAGLLRRCGPELPCGIVITDDILASGACSQFESAGVHIGSGGLQIATHANKGTTTLQEWSDRITRVEVDGKEIVEALFSLLALLMVGASPSETSTRIFGRLILPNS